MAPLLCAQCTSGNCELPILEPNLTLSWEPDVFGRDLTGNSWTPSNFDMFSTDIHAMVPDGDTVYVGLGSGIGRVCFFNSPNNEI